MTQGPEPRSGMPSPQLDEAEFKRRFLTRYVDPASEPLTDELDRIAAVACYPNYAGGQTRDWMNDIHPMWVRADGIMIVVPVN